MIVSAERMTLTEEVALWHAARSGDETALPRLVEANLEMIWPIARALSRGCGRWTSEDLFQEGALAMVEFSERWNPRHGVPFAAAARGRVRGAMKDFLRRRADSVRGQSIPTVSLDDAGINRGGRTLGEALGHDDEGEQPALDLSVLTDLELTVIEARILRRRPESFAEIARRVGADERALVAAQRSGMEKLLEQGRGD